MSKFYQDVACPEQDVEKLVLDTELEREFCFFYRKPDTDSKINFIHQKDVLDKIIENQADFLGPGKVPTQYEKKEKATEWKKYNENSFNEYFQLYELDAITKDLKKNKAPGIDNVTYEVLKLKSENFRIFRLLLYNLSWALGCFLNSARIALLIFLFKGDIKKRFLEPGYRPISLLLAMGKEIALLVAERIKSSFKTMPLSKHQYGFTGGRSPNMALGRKIDFILSNWDALSGNPHIGQRLCGSLSLDIAKAYDRVMRCFLVYKLWKRGLRGRILVWICDYFQMRYHLTRIGKYKGRKFPNYAGFGQGCPLSTYLWNLFIDELVEELENSVEFVNFFADDGEFISSGVNFKEISKKLQHAINILEAYFKKWQVLLSLTKTHLQPFVPKKYCDQKIVSVEKEMKTLTRRAVYKGVAHHDYTEFIPNKNKIDINNFRVKIYEQTIKPTLGKAVRVLGIHWDTCLDFSYHLHLLFERGIKRMAVIHRLSRDNGLGDVDLLHIVNQWLVTSLLYAGDIWDLAPPQKKHEIDSLIMNAYRKVLGVHNRATTAKVLHELGQLSPAEQRLLQALKTHVATERD